MMRKGKCSLDSWLYVLLVSFVFSNGFFASTLMADEQVVVTIESENHQEVIEAWRASRHERLKQPDGWLTLVGLEWLEDGESRIGSSADNDIQLSGGPPYWGSVVLQDSRLHFKNFDTDKVSVNGEPLPYAELIPDTEGNSCD